MVPQTSNHAPERKTRRERRKERITFTSEYDRWTTADIPILLTNWEKARRCVIYREAHETECTNDDQLTMILTTYSYQAIVTNTDLKPNKLLKWHADERTVLSPIQYIRQNE